MKKLITIILILALAVQCVAYAEDDSIVGYWYFYVDRDAYPEYMANLGDYDYVLIAYFFSKDGVVFLLENDIKGGSSTPSFISCGKWEQSEDGKYSAQMIGLGTCEITVKDNNDMYLSLPQSNNIKMRLRRMFQFNPYTDYIY